MAASTLYDYYTGLGQALPSTTARASLYSSNGLGSGYTGTAQQNTALLAKLQAGGAPTNTTSGGGYGTPGGYNQTPAGAPQPISNDPGYNDLTSFASSNASQRQTLVDRLNAELSGAYDTAANASGLNTARNTLNAAQSGYTASQVKENNLPVDVNNSVRGTFSNDSQRATDIATQDIPLHQDTANFLAALAPAEYAYSNAQQSTSDRVSLVRDAQARQLSGFDTNAQNQLAAIQAKVARGQQLTDEEFQRETQLSIAEKSYQATVQAARASAGGQIGAAQIGANASTANTASTNALNSKIAALQNPGIGLTKDTSGNILGVGPFGAPTTSNTANSGLNAALSKYFQ